MGDRSIIEEVEEEDENGVSERNRVETNDGNLPYNSGIAQKMAQYFKANTSQEDKAKVLHHMFSLH